MDIRSLVNLKTRKSRLSDSVNPICETVRGSEENWIVWIDNPAYD